MRRRGENLRRRISFRRQAKPQRLALVPVAQQPQGRMAARSEAAVRRRERGSRIAEAMRTTKTVCLLPYRLAA
jgi:hypothetical protein